MTKYFSRILIPLIIEYFVIFLLVKNI